MAKDKGEQIPPFEAWQTEITRPKPGPRRILSRADTFRKPIFSVYKPPRGAPTRGAKIFSWSVRLIFIIILAIAITSIIRGRVVSEWLPLVCVVVSIPFVIILAIWDAGKRKPTDDG